MYLQIPFRCMALFILYIYFWERNILARGYRHFKRGILVMRDYFGKTKFLYPWDGIFVNHARDPL